MSGVFTASVVDADTEAPVPWLATAYIAGSSLADAVTRYGPWPADAVLALAAGLAEGLLAIHSAGLVHRDLKPSNVLLAEDGPRVIDFGISRALESNTVTSAGIVIGSPAFMSPEQAEGHRVGPPSDVFSLGGVLAFAATGQGPFGTGSGAALLYRLCVRPHILNWGSTAREADARLPGDESLESAKLPPSRELHSVDGCPDTARVKRRVTGMDDEPVRTVDRRHVKWRRLPAGGHVAGVLKTTPLGSFFALGNGRWWHSLAGASRPSSSPISNQSSPPHGPMRSMTPPVERSRASL